MQYKCRWYPYNCNKITQFIRITSYNVCYTKLLRTYENWASYLAGDGVATLHPVIDLLEKRPDTDVTEPGTAEGDGRIGA